MPVNMLRFVPNKVIPLQYAGLLFSIFLMYWNSCTFFSVLGNPSLGGGGYYLVDPFLCSYYSISVCFIRLLTIESNTGAFLFFCFPLRSYHLVLEFPYLMLLRHRYSCQRALKVIQTYSRIKRIYLHIFVNSFLLNNLLPLFWLP